MSVVGAADASGAMDRMYRRQRHIYDLTRKFYLLGRDELIAGLKPPPGGAVLESPAAPAAISFAQPTPTPRRDSTVLTCPKRC